MSMTSRRALRGAGRVAIVLAAWGIILLAMPLVGPAGRQVAVIGERNAAARTILAAGGEVVEARRGATLARSDDPRFVRRLYAAGAVAVIEGRIAAGCFANAGA
jgi:hypothetical protein